MSLPEVYRNLSDEELVEIIDYPERYESQAVVAARLELDARGVEETQYDQLRSRLKERYESTFVKLWRRIFLRGKG